MKSSGKRGSWIVTLPLVGGLTAFFLLVYLPTQRSIGEVRETLQQKRAFISSTTSLPEQIAAAELALRECETYNQHWANTAGGEAAVPELFATINRQAGLAGTITTRFDPQPAAPLESIVEHSVALGVAGQFSQVFQFLSQLEQLPQTLWIEDLRLEAPRKDGQETVCSADLVIFADKLGNSD